MKRFQLAAELLPDKHGDEFRRPFEQTRLVAAQMDRDMNRTWLALVMAAGAREFGPFTLYDVVDRMEGARPGPTARAIQGLELLGLVRSVED